MGHRPVRQAHVNLRALVLNGDNKKRYMRRIAMFKKLVCTTLFLAFGTALLWAAPQMEKEKGSAPQTVTGCLEKGSEAEGYFLISEGKKHWELYPENGVSLAEHVGHTVTVSGTVAHRSADQEKVSQPNEKKETGSKQHADLSVSSVKHVSDTCKK